MYAAMLARGFGGEMGEAGSYHMRANDWLFLVGALVLAVASLAIGRWLG